MPARHLFFLFGFLTVLLPGPAPAQEVTRQNDQQALQEKFAWAVEATRDYIAKAEGWPESDYKIILKLDNPDQPKALTARVLRRGGPFSASESTFFDWDECPISPPICWNELRFSVETKKIYYMLWGTQ